MINHALVELARLSAGLTQGELATRIGKSQALVSQVESGQRDIPEESIDLWAEACKVPPSFLQRVDTPMTDTVACMVHRRMATLPIRPFNQANAQVKQASLELDSLFGEVEVVPALEIPTIPPGTGPADAADALRRAWRIPSGPILNLVQLVESAGIAVISIEAMHEKHSGVSYRGHWFDWLIAVNSSHPASRRRVTVAHELGHIVMCHDQQLAVNDQEARAVEDEAYAFGAALLLPEDDARRDLRNLSLRRLVELKQRWRVSIAFLIMRAKECELIGEQQATRLFIDLSSLPGGRRREPAEFSPEEPTLVRRMIDGLQKEGVSLAEVADIMTATEQGVRTKYLNERSHLRPIREHGPRTRLEL